MEGRLTPRARIVLILGVAGFLVTTGLVSVAIVETAAQQSQPETDNTVTRIALGANGSADWTVQIRTRLDTAEAVQEYEVFQERIRTNSSVYLDPFRQRMRGTVARAANATGREMRADGFVIETTIQEVPRRWGVVTFRFTWTNFAVPADGRLVVGDVFQGGFFLAPNDSLEVHSPPEHTIDDVSPTPSDRSNGSVTWVGREDFADERPSVTFATTDGQTASNGETTVTPSLPPVVPGGGGGFVDAIWAVILFLLIGTGSFIVYRRWSDVGQQKDPPSGQASEPTDQSEAPVMTDEERVMELLESRDGRVRQADIAEAFEWSASKTSRVIGALVEDGEVEKLQLGRENLIDLVDDGA